MRTLYIISDLHLGGRPHGLTRDGAVQAGYQINHAYGALVAFIDWVRDQTGPDRQAELIINGDIVDFLAEDDYPDGAQAWTADEQAVCAKLDLIVARTRDGSQRGVFDALAGLRAHGVSLTLILGNHDVELSLPAVRRHLIGLLGGERAGLRFIYDGEAYLTDRVLIEHGNRYDRWNRLDYDALRQERSIRSRGLQPAAARFSPPAGTHLVVEVLNRIKKQYRFIDLLKPETGAALPLLMALEPSLGRYLDALVKANLAQPLFDAGGADAMGQPAARGYMAGQAAPAPAPALEDVLTEELDREDAQLFLQSSQHASLAGPPPGDWMSSQASHLAAGSGALGIAAGAVHAAADGLAALARRAGASVSDVRQRQLHAALRRVIARDGAFNPQREDSHYLSAAEAVVAGGAADIVINGHTHLPKQIRLDQPGRPCWYLNTGTWCDVLRLPPMSLSFDDARATLDHFMAALRTNDLDGLVCRYLSWVEVRITPGSAPEPFLHSYCGPGRERCAPLTAHGMPAP
jgi:UDP-2,3-diacylglucosamine pyrophosphatase LpxH